MKSHKNLILLLFVIVVGTIATAGIRQKQKNSSQNNQRVTDTSAWPLADYDASPPADPVERAKRQRRSQIYDKSEWAVNPADVADTTVRVDYVDPKLPVFPVTQSDVVLIGEVISARSYLSNDKTGVYSEFTVHVNEVLKNNLGVTLSAGGLIDIEREGGRVRFSSGRVHRYSIDKENMPRVKGKYLFFLASRDQEQPLHILTGYELHDGRVFPLDELPQMKAHQGENETSFLNILRAALTIPPQTPSN